MPLSFDSLYLRIDVRSTSAAVWHAPDLLPLLDLLLHRKGGCEGVVVCVILEGYFFSVHAHPFALLLLKDRFVGHVNFHLHLDVRLRYWLEIRILCDV